MKPVIRILLAALLLGLAAEASAAEKHWVNVEGGTWVPGPRTVERIKGQIGPFVQAQAVAEGVKLGDLGAYTFQYEGYEENGKKLVFVNAFCSKGDPREVKKELIMVMNGGTCFFNLSYDVENDELVGLAMNNGPDTADRYVQAAR